MEAAIQAYDCDNGEVPTQNNHIQAQKHSKEDVLDFSKVGEPQQHKLCDRGEVSLVDSVPKIDLQRTGMKEKTVYLP